MAEKLPTIPKSIESEQAFLGSLIQDPKSWEKIDKRPDVDDFFDPVNKTIYKEIYELLINDQPIDILMLEEALKNKSLLEKVGGIDYLTNLVRKRPTSAHVAAYGEKIIEKALMRRLISVSTKTIENVTNSEDGVKDILDKAESDIFSITTDSEKKHGLQKIGPIVNDMVENIYETKGKTNQIITGFSKLDEIVKGFQKSDLVVIAGRPSMGKTSLAMNIAEDIVFKQGKKVGFFSLEMSSQSIALRMLSSLSRVETSKIRDELDGLSSADTKSVTSAIEMVKDCDFFIDDSAGMTPMDLKAKARRMKRETGIDVLVIDYLQLISIPNFREGRVNELAEVTRILKSIAKDCDMPVIALSQLNRLVEARNDKRPYLSDLRESGAIEQDADIVLFIYRDEVYNKNSDDKGVAEINVAKHRNGETGMAKLTFLRHCTRFEDYHPQIINAAKGDDV